MSHTIQLLVTLHGALIMAGLSPRESPRLSQTSPIPNNEDLNKAILEAAQKLSITELKPKQHEAIVSYVTGNDTLVVLPTGYGKSLIYAILPLILDKLRGKIGFVTCIIIL